MLKCGLASVLQQHATTALVLRAVLPLVCIRALAPYRPSRGIAWPVLFVLKTATVQALIQVRIQCRIVAHLDARQQFLANGAHNTDRPRRLSP